MKFNYIFLFLILITIFMTSCTSNSSENNVTGNTLISNSPKEINVDKVEVIHFHGTNQCYSCITVGDLTEETLKTYFADELESGIIVFEHINGEVAQYRDLVVKYEATGSSIWIGVYDGEDFSKEQNIQVWYKIGNKANFMTYFKGVIEEKLKGN